MTTAATRMARLRARRAALGLRRRDVYVHNDDWQMVREFVARLMRMRSTTPKATP